MYRLLLIIPVIFLNSCTYYFSVNHFDNHFKKDSSFNFERNSSTNFSKNNQVAYIQQPMVMHWAEMDFADWQKSAKLTANRIVLAKLAAGVDVFETNAYLLKATPNATIGTKWKLNPNGDYDFTEVVLAFMLNKFGNDSSIILPAVANHIAENLIVSGGSKPHLKTPGTLGLLRETENHVLMGTTALYLKNQWVLANTNTNIEFDNSINGVEQFLIKFLSSLTKSGFYEFNSDPYSGYSLTAILMLQDQAKSLEIKQLCQIILDQTFYQHALSSLNFKFYPPIRRIMERANDPQLSKNPVNSLALTFYAMAKNQLVETDWVQHNYHQALIALLSSYTLPNEIVNILDGEKEHYFLKVGRGPNSAPEIYSGSSNFLITAGGVNQKPASQLGYRPTTLLLNDKAENLEDVFHLISNRKKEKWNHTGVWDRLAVVDGTVAIPKDKLPLISDNNWSIFKENNLLIAVFQSTEMALLTVYEEWKGSEIELLKALTQSNSKESLFTAFKFPDTNDEVKYNLNSKKKRWMITHVNGNKVNRKFLKWQRFEI